MLMRDTAQGGDIQDTHSHHKSSLCQTEAGGWTKYLTIEHRVFSTMSVSFYFFLWIKTIG